ncbi:hypothetical protein [Brevundimonas aurantiaca]|uniref:hypothetical protein n=1 Tax=Brevundimonas aurantiaca TaxID=74316 RepID=UPI003018315F
MALTLTQAGGVYARAVIGAGRELSAMLDTMLVPSETGPCLPPSRFAEFEQAFGDILFSAPANANPTTQAELREALALFHEFGQPIMDEMSVLAARLLMPWTAAHAQMMRMLESPVAGHA